MSDDSAVTFVMSVADEFRSHVLAVIGAEPCVVRGASWTPDGVELDYVLEPGGLLPDRISRDHVVGLLARTYKRRSSRAVEWQVPLPPDRFQAVLEEHFPVYRQSGLEVGPGWFDLHWAVGQWLEEVDPDREPFMQVKEKFGTLRLHGPVTNAGEPVIEAAELLSGHICEVCGKQGQRVTRGGVLTLCPEHASA